MIPVRKSNVPRNTVYMSRSDYTDTQFHDTYPHNVIHDTERNLSFVFLSRLLELWLKFSYKYDIIFFHSRYSMMN